MEQLNREGPISSAAWAGRVSPDLQAETLSEVSTTSQFYASSWGKRRVSSDRHSYAARQRAPRHSVQARPPRHAAPDTYLLLQQVSKPPGRQKAGPASARAPALAPINGVNCVPAPAPCSVRSLRDLCHLTEVVAGRGCGARVAQGRLPPPPQAGLRLGPPLPPLPTLVGYPKVQAAAGCPRAIVAAATGPDGAAESLSGEALRVRLVQRPGPAAQPHHAGRESEDVSSACPRWWKRHCRSSGGSRSDCPPRQKETPSAVLGVDGKAEGLSTRAAPG
ncbi:SH3 domain-binding protein 1-like [Psammomys obesus]|uniref:SH3 domain-binding protein 1-like n=1 Tax=Psammomys obesus TaxID=48139 RepID=UPI002452E961|nr:SH3 domain-binding protein 1-like [Psammomys obesus]